MAAGPHKKKVKTLLAFEIKDNPHTAGALQTPRAMLKHLGPELPVQREDKRILMSPAGHSFRTT